MANTRTHTRSAKTQQHKVATTGNGQLEEFFMDALKDIYWAEKALVKSLPKMSKAATTDALSMAIDEHLSQTEEHVNRLEQVFGLLGHKPQAKKCEAMEGLLKEADSIVEETNEGSMTRDVGIIMAAQKVEHYEIATYGGMVQLASIIGHDDVAELLRQTLEEEKTADVRLTEIAENNINQEAEEEDNNDNDKAGDE